MKSKYFLPVLILSFIFSCQKNKAHDDNYSNADDKLEQEAQILKNDKNDSIIVSYYADGDKVAVKIKRGNEKEHQLSARGINEKYEPIFADEAYEWQIMEDGRSGRLIDKNGNTEIYK